MATFIGTLIVAFVDRGARQVFAIGFVLAAASYGCLIQTGVSYLPTSWALGHLYTVVEQGRWIDTDTGKELPNFDPSKTPQRIRIVGNRGLPVDVWEERPAEATFIRIGRIWFALLVGYVGGIFACFVHGRRTREERKLPPETS